MLRATLAVLLASVAGFGAPPATEGNSPGKKVAATIDAGSTAAPISPYVYGQFIEHIGDMVNRSLWAEMILGGHPKPANDGHLKTGQRRTRAGH
jgi:alpha-N-arabinofuranosidase